MKNSSFPDVSRTKFASIVLGALLAWLTLGGVVFSQTYRGGAGTMDSPYWVREREYGLLVYESFCGQTIEDNSFELGGQYVVDIRKRQKKIIIDRRNPAGGNSIIRWEGESNEEWRLQVFDNFGFGIKLFENSKFMQSEIKDFPNFIGPLVAHVGKWIKQNAEYNYVGTQNGDVTASGTEIKDNSYENEPNYNANLHPAKSTNFNFGACEDYWSFSYAMKYVGETISEGSCDSGNPTMPPTGLFEMTDYLDWVMAGRQLESYATHVMNSIYSVLNVRPFIVWPNEDIRFDYDHYNDAEVRPEIRPFPVL